MRKTFMKRKKSSVICVVVGVILILLLQILTIRAESLGLGAFNGVFMACQFAICLILVRVDRMHGMTIVSVLLIANITIIVYTIAMRRTISPLPGLCNSIIYLISLTLLERQFSAREKEAVTDFLTKLLNRRGMYKLLAKKVQEKQPFYVIFFEITNFKFVRDTYGHSFGDGILVEVANRMKMVVGNQGKIARMAGDEFVVVTEGDCNPEEMADRIIAKVSEKISVTYGNSPVERYLNASAGIASYPDNTKDSDTLIKCADIAMYQATKEKRKVCFFDKDVEAYLNRQVEVEKLIIDSLVNEYFYLVYQPQYDMGKKRIRGYEALLRLQLPDGTMVRPGEFIPVAERDDLILRIDDYVLRRALREFKPIVERKQEIVVSVNVSAKNFSAFDFVERVESFVREEAFPPQHLELEITEYCFINGTDVAVSNIEKLRDMGISVALDDFGTGYTSLSSLVKLPINLLKIDKSLIDDVEENEKNRDFVRAVVSMGHLMGCEVLAEGVENEKQLEVLEKHDCDYVQGFIWSKPVEYKEILMQ